MQRSDAVDGFRLAYDREGAGPPVVLLHGWPGSRRDYRAVWPLLVHEADLVAPDLRGFGESDRHSRTAREAYSAERQVDGVLALIHELALDSPVVVGYDVGSRVAQAVARRDPARVRALVLSPPLPGVGDRIRSAAGQREFWYQAFHQLPLADELIDGRPHAVRAYLRHFWEHWSAPRWSLPADELDRLVELYAARGAFAASIAWYRAGAGAVAHSQAERPPRSGDRLDVPTTVVWGGEDPLFPVAWSDRLKEFFADVELRLLPGIGHFVPLEAAEAIAGAVRERLAS